MMDGSWEEGSQRRAWKALSLNLKVLLSGSLGSRRVVQLVYVGGTTNGFARLARNEPKWSFGTEF